MVFYNRVKEQKGEKKNIFDNNDLKNAEKNVTLYSKNAQCIINHSALNFNL